MKKALIALSMVAAVALTSCSSSVAFVGGNVAENSGKKVKSETSNMNILMLTTMKVDKAEEAVKGLSSQCAGSEVVNVTSHWKNSSYGPIAFETLTVTGYCK